jgi:succinoglycan biosynthesis transport protein ExoP
VEAAADTRRGTARYLQALLEHWPFIALTVVLALGAAIGYLSVADKRYVAETDILVAPVSSDDERFTGIPLLRESVESRSVLTVARLLQGPPVVDTVRRRLKLAENREKLLDRVEIRPQQQSNILTVRASAGSPARAAAVANAFADALVARRTAAFQTALNAVVERLAARLESTPRGSPEAVALAGRLADLRGLVGARDPTLTIATRAFPPQDEEWPRPALSLAVALLAGVLLGMGVAVTIELANPLVLREEEVASDYGVPVLARIPRMSRRAYLRAMRSAGAVPPNVAEGFRRLRAAIEAQSDSRRPPASIVVTSARSGDGATTTAIGLARAFAAGRKRVILVDFDLGGTTIADVFRTAPATRSGLARLLLDGIDAGEVLVPAPEYGDALRLVLSAPADGRLVDLVQPDQIERILTELATQADVVVVDSPSPSEAAYALTLADAAAAVLIVVQLGRTRRDRLRELTRVLDHAGARLLGGAVISRRRSRPDGARRAAGWTTEVDDTAARAPSALESARKAEG